MVPSAPLLNDIVAKFGEKDEKVVLGPRSDWHPARRYYISGLIHVYSVTYLYSFFTPIPPNAGVHLPTTISLVHLNGLYGFRFQRATTSMLPGIEPIESNSSTLVAPGLSSFVDVAKTAEPAPAPMATGVVGNQGAQGTENGQAQGQGQGQS
jgi:hypothetical protein